MKKLLLGSTALLLSVGVAAAEVRVSGDGRMGILYDNRAAEDFGFTQRIRIRFDASGTTDTGMTFGGFVRMQDAIPAAAGGVGNLGTLPRGDTRVTSGGHNVFVSGAFGRLAMGDVAGAVQTATRDLHEVGLTGLGFANEFTYLQRDFGGGVFGADNFGPNALYTYTFDIITVSASISQPRGRIIVDADTGEEVLQSSTVYGIGARIDLGTFVEGVWLGGGYEYADREGLDSVEHATLGAGWDFGIGEVRALYGRISSNGVNSLGLARNEQMGISASGTFDQATVLGYWRRDFAGANNYGIGAQYALGGGARIVGGINYADPLEGQSRTRADLGVALSF